MVVRDEKTGISMRFIEQFDVERAKVITLEDVEIARATTTEELPEIFAKILKRLGVRVVDKTPW